MAASMEKLRFVLQKPRIPFSHESKHNLPLYYALRKFTGNACPVKPVSSKTDKDGFRVYQIPGASKTEVVEKRRTVIGKPIPPPREKRMRVDQDWTDVWPTAATFKPSVVPLPIRQGFIKNPGENSGITPYKYNNLELMKVPNFLHLTPRHINKHCAAIKKFCTPWPRELNNEQIINENFPLKKTSSDYLYAGPSLRDPRSRTVKLKFELDCLELDTHARDKLIRLLGDRYDQKTGEVTLIADCCPLKKQNEDYVKYLLTALYYESWKVEPWEEEITWADLKYYDWERSKTKDKMETLVSKLPDGSNAQLKEKNLSKYADAVTKLHNDGESDETLDKYKQTVLEMLKLKTTSS